MAQRNEVPLNLIWPALGLDEQRAYSEQAPFSTPGALNVRSKGTIEGRDRGGSRPGFQWDDGVQLGQAGFREVVMLDKVTNTRDDGFEIWQDLFDYSSTAASIAEGPWAAMANLDGAVPIDAENHYAINPDAGVVKGSVLSALNPALDTGSAYQIALDILPVDIEGEPAHHGSYQIYACMDDATPLWTQNCIVVGIDLYQLDDKIDLFMTRYVGSGSTPSNQLDIVADVGMPGQFIVEISGTTVTAYWRGEELHSNDFGSLPSGKRIGFGMSNQREFTTWPHPPCIVDRFGLKYYSAASKRRKQERIVAASGGYVYVGNDFDALSPIGGVGSEETWLGVDGRIASAEHLQKLFIADWEWSGERILTGSVDIGDGGTPYELSKSGVNWSTIGIVPDRDVALIYNPTGNAVYGAYRIASVDAGHLTLVHGSDESNHEYPASGATGTCSVRVAVSPKVFDPGTGLIGLWLTDVYTAGERALGGTWDEYTEYRSTTPIADVHKNEVPLGCRLMCLWNDRMVLSGDRIFPHHIYMGRQGDPFDFDYGWSGDDSERAIAMQSSYGERIGQEVVALIPHSNDYLITGTINEMWMLRGDPGQEGTQLDNLSREIGILDAKAWCHGPSGEIIWLSRHGLFQMRPHAEAYPVALAVDRLPRPLRHLDNITHQFETLLYFDTRDNGIHIVMTPINYEQQGYHYWFDWARKSFWPVEHSPDFDAFSMMTYPKISGKRSSVLFGGRDGYIRHLEDDHARDDSTAFASHVLYGPFRLGNDEDRDGILKELLGVLAGQTYSGGGSHTTSGPVTWSIYVAETAEQAVRDARASQTPLATGLWSFPTTVSTGRQHVVRPRARGVYAILKLEGGAVAGKRWAIEAIKVVFRRLGRHRTTT